MPKKMPDQMMADLQEQRRQCGHVPGVPLARCAMLPDAEEPDSLSCATSWDRHLILRRARGWAIDNLAAHAVRSKAPPASLRMPSRPCPQEVVEPLDANDPLRGVAGKCLVKVVERPFGMLVANHGLPRVTDVKPASAAAGAGVRIGWVVTAIDNLAVDSSTWKGAFRETLVPFIVAFDTKAPLHTGTAFLPTGDPTTDGAPPKAAPNPSKPPVTTLGPVAGSVGASSSAGAAGGAVSSVEADARAAPRLRISAVSYECAASGERLPLPSPPLPRLDDAVAAPVPVPIAEDPEDRVLLQELAELFPRSRQRLGSQPLPARQPAQGGPTPRDSYYNYADLSAGGPRGGGGAAAPTPGPPTLPARPAAPVPFTPQAGEESSPPAQQGLQNLPSPRRGPIDPMAAREGPPLPTVEDRRYGRVYSTVWGHFVEGYGYGRNKAIHFA